MSVVDRLDDYQQRHRWLGFPLAVVYKYADDQAGYLAALITYYGFLSLFPLLLLFVTILGFVLNGNPELQQRVLGSALQQFPIIGTQLRENVHSLRGSGAGLVVGVLVSLYGGLGVAQATQAALNRVWSVPRNERPNPLLSRARGLLVLLLMGTGVIVTTVLSALGAAGAEYGTDIGMGARVLATALSVAANVVLFVVAFRLMTAREIGTRDVLLGAVCAAVGWQVLQSLGVYYVASHLKGATEVYGLFGLVLGLVLWIYVEAVIVVLSAEINVVRARRLWPRALLTPFTDDVELTRADERAYTGYADSERHKGFEEVDVSFNNPPGRDQAAPRDD
jgi:YihY family inner membrane protein